MKITSELAILDVKKGRQALLKALPDNGVDIVRIPVTITGYISHTWGRDDGISQEFQVDVTAVELGKVIKP